MSKRTKAQRPRFFQPQDYLILGIGALVGGAFVLGTWAWINAY